MSLFNNKQGKESLPKEGLGKLSLPNNGQGKESLPNNVHRKEYLSNSRKKARGPDQIPNEAFTEADEKTK